MRKTEKTYKTYNINQNESIALKRHCQKLNTEEQAELFRCALESNSQIATHILYSIYNNVSYDKLIGITYVPIAKNSFYAYQHEALARFKESLKSKGEWI